MHGVPYSLRYTRGGVVRVGVGRGRHTLVVGSGDRVAEQTIEVASFQPTSLVIDLGSREHLVFVGCPPAVEPYLHGDVQAAARALERDGHVAVAQRLLARVARERGQLAAAAEHFERAGQPLEAAELHAELEQWKQAARLYESAGELGARGRDVPGGGRARPAPGIPSSAPGVTTRPRTPTARRATCRTGSNRSRSPAGPSRRPRSRSSARTGARAIRSLQLVTASDAEYLEAAQLLVEAYQRQGHLDLATRKVEEVVANKGAESMPLETCDQLAHRLEESGDFDRALDVLELIRSHDATWPNVATRIEGLRKRRSGSQQSVSGGRDGRPRPATPSARPRATKCSRSSAAAGWESSSRPATAAWGASSRSSACPTACATTRRPSSSSCARRAPPPRSTTRTS